MTNRAATVAETQANGLGSGARVRQAVTDTAVHSLSDDGEREDVER